MDLQDLLVTVFEDLRHCRTIPPDTAIVGVERERVFAIGVRVDGVIGDITTHFMEGRVTL